jgi:hypothetical protein
MKLELREFVGWQDQSGATSFIFILVMLIKFLDANKLSEHQILHFILCEFKTIKFITARI